jgi:hypothetical protein
MQFSDQAAGKETRYVTHKRLGGPELFRKEKYLLCLTGFEPRTVQHLAVGSERKTKLNPATCGRKKQAGPF